MTFQVLEKVMFMGGMTHSQEDSVETMQVLWSFKSVFWMRLEVGRGALAQDGNARQDKLYGKTITHSRLQESAKLQSGDPTKQSHKRVSGSSLGFVLRMLYALFAQSMPCM
jgi:hypothetical protein